MTEKAKRKNAPDKAYSLLELVLVLGILAVLSSSLSFGITSELSKKQLKKSAKIIEQQMLLASILAKELGETVFIEFKNQETINDEIEGEITLMARKILKVKKLPKTIIIDTANFSVFKNRAHFFKEGSSSPGTISIKDKGSHHFCDLSLSLTGKVKTTCH